MFTKITHDIKVTVVPRYLADESDPEDDRYVWTYTVTLENHGRQQLQLLNRRWHITDTLGRTQEVRGAGVVGEQPVLKHGERFQDTSGTHLAAPSGLMTGSYEMQGEQGESVNISIPAFSLDSPTQRLRAN